MAFSTLKFTFQQWMLGDRWVLHRATHGTRMNGSCFPFYSNYQSCTSDCFGIILYRQRSFPSSTPHPQIKTFHGFCLLLDIMCPNLIRGPFARYAISPYGLRQLSRYFGHLNNINLLDVNGILLCSPYVSLQCLQKLPCWSENLLNFFTDINFEKGRNTEHLFCIIVQLEASCSPV